jgi:hypothetical protein
MKYALLIYPGPGRAAYNALPEDEQQAVLAEFMELARAPGVYASEQLEPAETATSVRVEDGKARITDGPFADTKEVLGGFYLLDVPNLDQALDYAAKLPIARMGGVVEVHRLVER